MPSEAELLKDFTGTVRLFPLPNLVHFPHVVQGLHIFEPRYRAMMADTLADNQLMALVMLKPGWETDYEGTPAIERVACLGRVGQWEKFIDGRYNLQLHGMARLELLEELETSKPYRMAAARIIPENAPDDLEKLKSLRSELADAVLPRFADESSAHRQLEELFHGEMPIGSICDMLAYALPLPLELKQQLLEEADVAVRCMVLANALIVKSSARERKFPPDFSNN